jgi:hypothetical protein
MTAEWISNYTRASADQADALFMFYRELQKQPPCPPSGQWPVTLTRLRSERSSIREQKPPGSVQISHKQYCQILGRFWLFGGAESSVFLFGVQGYHPGFGMGNVGFWCHFWIMTNISDIHCDTFYIRIESFVRIWRKEVNYNDTGSQSSDP